MPAAAAELQTGRTVAVTAKRQPNNTLLASLVTVFPPAQTIPLGQRPMDAGNLMTNATIDKVAGDTLTVTFPGGGEQVTLAPDVVLTTIGSGTAADVTVGMTVNATVRDGVAQTASVQ